MAAKPIKTLELHYKMIQFLIILIISLLIVGPSPTNTFSVPDCRSMVKTLVCGVKTITWGAGSCKVSGSKSFLIIYY